MANTLGASSGRLACQSASRSLRSAPITSITIMVRAKARICPALWRLLRLRCCQAKRHINGRSRCARRWRKCKIRPFSASSIITTSTLPPPIMPSVIGRSWVNRNSSRVKAINASEVISQPDNGTGCNSRRSTRSGVTRASGSR